DSGTKNASLQVFALGFGYAIARNRSWRPLVAIQFAHERRQVFRNGGASGIGKFGPQSSSKRLHEFHRVERDSGQTAHGLRPPLFENISRFAPRAELACSISIKAPPGVGHHARGARHAVSPETSPREGGSSPPKCRCLIFASRLRIVCPTPDSTRVKFAFSRRRKARDHTCGMQQVPLAGCVFSRRPDRLSWGGLRDAQPPQPSPLPQLSTARP